MDRNRMHADPWAVFWSEYCERVEAVWLHSELTGVSFEELWEADARDLILDRDDELLRN